jgi:hypothetical protein
MIGMEVKESLQPSGAWLRAFLRKIAASLLPWHVNCVIAQVETLVEHVQLN